MKEIGIQLLNHRLSSDWWKRLVRCFVRENAELQIRCWSDEITEISRASRYGATHIEGGEVCIDGVVSRAFIDELTSSPEPTDKSVYNKMTEYFTIRVGDGDFVFESEHYGTEIYLRGSDEDAARLCEILKPIVDDFSISISDVCM